MTVHFFVPPAAQRVGGLDAAIHGLRGALTQRGASVDEELPARGSAGHVAHFHGLWQPRHALVARECAVRKIPVVISPHGMFEPWAWRHKRWKKWFYFQLVEKRRLTRADALLATAPAEAARLREFFPRQRIESLPLGMTGDARPDYEAARADLGWSQDERVLLFLSRIHQKKGLDLLLRALAGLSTGAASRLVIVGDGEKKYVRHLQRFAAENARALPQIDWIGAVWGEARWRYFQGADLFCLPTHSENFGLAVLESCQVGTPSLTTVDTPWADELRDGRGFIGKPNVESVRDLLAEFFRGPRRSPAQRLVLADWARSKFHWDAIATRYIEFYEKLGEPR